MRILFVSYMHPAIAPGGAQQVAYEMYQAALKRGHEAFLIAALEPPQEAEYGKPGAPIVPAPGKNGEYFYFPQYYNFLHLSVGDWRTIKFFKDFVASLRPDVIQFHHYHLIGVEAIRAARLAAPNAHISMTFHEMMAICLANGQMVKTPSRDLCVSSSPIDCHGCFDQLRPEFFTLRAARLRAALDECDSFIFPTEFIAQRYVDWGLKQEKCFLVSNGQKHPAPNAPRAQHSRFVNRFGFFGQFIDNKGIDIVLEALLILAHENRVPECGIAFMINGGNSHYATPEYIEKIDKLTKQIQKLGNDRIHVFALGKYNRDQLAERMAMVDWVIAPSTWWEVFGLVVSEAWMFGRPVIVSDIAGLGERVKNGVNGFSFPARNSRALASLIERLAGNDLEWLRAHAGIKQDWSDLDMFDAYVATWDQPESTSDILAVGDEIGLTRVF